MGILVEFNTDLALRAYNTPDRLPEECLPETLEVGGIYAFLKQGQRNYWLQGAIPLMITTGNSNLSRSVAAVSILSAEHCRDEDGVLWTSGFYGVHAVFNLEDATTHFEGMDWKGTGDITLPREKAHYKSRARIGVHMGFAYSAKIGDAR